MSSQFFFLLAFCTFLLYFGLKFRRFRVLFMQHTHNLSNAESYHWLYSFQQQNSACWSWAVLSAADIYVCPGGNDSAPRRELLFLFSDFNLSRMSENMSHKFSLTAGRHIRVAWPRHKEHLLTMMSPRLLVPLISRRKREINSVNRVREKKGRNICWQNLILLFFFVLLFFSIILSTHNTRSSASIEENMRWREAREARNDGRPNEK